MGFLNKAVRYGEEFAETLPRTEVGRVLSPISLFNKEQYGKLAKLADEQGMTNMLSEMGSNYFKGKTVSRVGDAGIEYAKENADVLLSRSRTRKVVVGGLAGLAAANAMGINPGGITDKVNNLVSLGGHYTVGRTLMEMGGKSKAAGVGYLGLTAYNTLFNPGDNPGPM